MGREKRGRTVRVRRPGLSLSAFRGYNLGVKIILNLNNESWKRLAVLAKMRGQEPATLAEDLLAQLLEGQLKKTDEEVGNTGDIAEVLAARLLAVDKSGAQIKNALAELQMLDETPHNKLTKARFSAALKQVGLGQSSKIYRVEE